MKKRGYLSKIRTAVVIEGLLLLIAGMVWHTGAEGSLRMVNGEAEKRDTIKWVDFGVSYEALCLAYEWDVRTYGTDVHVDWVELLAYLGAKYGGDFDAHGKSMAGDMEKLVQSLVSGDSTMEKLTADMKYYEYYKEAYGAVLSGMVGEYSVRMSEQDTWEKRYGLKAFSPIAKGFEYSHFDDFGTSRSYGYKRQHLGHDMMGQVGTPIIAVESGYVEALGWNQYGGWRIGIRSFDKKRYYYYAHLRQNYPYAEGLEEGSTVTAGDVIGYMGHTGYSTKENVNNIKVTHLHWGLELIFDEERREKGNEIWVDVYPLTRFLYQNRSEAAKVEGTKEWKRITEMSDPEVEKAKAQGRKTEEISVRLMKMQERHCKTKRAMLKYKQSAMIKK